MFSPKKQYDIQSTLNDEFQAVYTPVKLVSPWYSFLGLSDRYEPFTDSKDVPLTYNNPEEAKEHILSVVRKEYIGKPLPPLDFDPHKEVLAELYANPNVPLESPNQAVKVPMTTYDVGVHG